jgi:hypothetical protein
MVVAMSSMLILAVIVLRTRCYPGRSSLGPSTSDSQVNNGSSSVCGGQVEDLLVGARESGRPNRSTPNVELSVLEGQVKDLPDPGNHANQ